MALIDVVGITKEFGGLKAVDGVSLQVRKGEIVSLIGPNGAGKTTVFNLMTGIYRVDSGSVRFDGREITNLPPRGIVRAGVSRTFQNIRLFSNLRVIENVLLGEHDSIRYSFLDALLRTRRYRAAERGGAQQALEILERIGLKDEMNSYAGDLPYGKQRRLEIARAIATGARLILLDEPAAGMNPQESEDLMQFIRALRDDGFTILMIEHDMRIVMNVSDRIYVMNYGRVIADGTPVEIARNPEVISAYLGESED